MSPATAYMVAAELTKLMEVVLGPDAKDGERKREEYEERENGDLWALFRVFKWVFLFVSLKLSNGEDESLWEARSFPR